MKDEQQILAYYQSQRAQWISKKQRFTDGETNLLALILLEQSITFTLHWVLERPLDEIPAADRYAYSRFLEVADRDHSLPAQVEYIFKANPFDKNKGH